MRQDIGPAHSNITSMNPKIYLVSDAMSDERFGIVGDMGGGKWKFSQ